MQELSDIVPQLSLRIGDVFIHDPSRCVLTEGLDTVSQLDLVFPADEGDSAAADFARGTEVELLGGYADSVLSWPGVVTKSVVGRLLTVGARGAERLLLAPVSQAWTDAGPADIARGLLEHTDLPATVSAEGAARRHFVASGQSIRDALDLVSTYWSLDGHKPLLIDNAFWWGPLLSSPRALTPQRAELVEERTLTELTELHRGFGRLSALVTPSLRLGNVVTLRTRAGEEFRALLTRVEHSFAPDLYTRAEWERV
jgi:hypothetical protein